MNDTLALPLSVQDYKDKIQQSSEKLQRRSRKIQLVATSVAAILSVVLLLVLYILVDTMVAWRQDDLATTIESPSVESASQREIAAIEPTPELSSSTQTTQQLTFCYMHSMPSGSRLRKEPDWGLDFIGTTLGEGEPLAILKSEKRITSSNQIIRWYYVQRSSGEQGWIDTKYCEKH